MRNILVTGGNRGIGLAIVKELAQESADSILLGCRNLDKGTHIASQIGKNVKAVKVDLSQREILNENISHIQKQYPRIDVLINNAGILIEGTFLKTTHDELEKSLRINVLSAYQLMKAFLPNMIANGYGRVINISSGWGAFSDGLTGPFGYSFSKASLNALTLTASRELPHHNVKINSMCPGWVQTDMGGAEAPRTPQKGAETAVWLANLPESGPNGGFFRDMKLIEW